MYSFHVSICVCCKLASPQPIILMLLKSVHTMNGHGWDYWLTLLNLQNAVGFLLIFLHFIPITKIIQESPGLTIIGIWHANTHMTLWLLWVTKTEISPYYSYTMSCGQVMRIKKNTNYGITNWSNSKFSKLA